VIQKLVVLPGTNGLWLQLLALSLSGGPQQLTHHIEQHVYWRKGYVSTSVGNWFIAIVDPPNSLETPLPLPFTTACRTREMADWTVMAGDEAEGPERRGVRRGWSSLQVGREGASRTTGDALLSIKDADRHSRAAGPWWGCEAEGDRHGVSELNLGDGGDEPESDCDERMSN
jgi:hypothetical protein